MKIDRVAWSAFAVVAGLLIADLPAAAQSCEADPALTTPPFGFNFLVDSFEVTGNLNFFDDFEDGSRDTGPTAMLLDAPPFPFDFSQGETRTTEADGYLVLDGQSGAEIFVRGPLAGEMRDTVVLETPIPGIGTGQSTITALFAPLLPEVNTPPPGYGIFIAAADEAAGTFAGSYLKASALASDTMQLTFFDQDVNILDQAVIEPFSAVVQGGLALRLVIDHTTATAFPQYSLDGGRSFLDFRRGALNTVFAPGTVNGELFAGFLGQGVAPPVEEIPTVSYWGLLVLGTLLAAAAVYLIVRFR